MAQKQDNRRLLIGVGIFALLIGINVFVRLGRTPRPPVAPPSAQTLQTPDPGQVGQTPQPPMGQPSAPAQPQPTLSPPPSLVPPSPSLASAPDLTPLFAAPLPRTTPLEAIQVLRDRLLLLPPILQGPPEWGRKPVPRATSDGRNPFRWSLPEPPPDTLATITATAPATIEPPKPEETKIVFSGSVVMGGKTFALLRKGKEMHLLEENSPVPQSTLVVATISTESTALKDITGETIVAKGEPQNNLGFLKALAALQRSDGFQPLPIHEPGTGSASLDPICFLTGGQLYHAVQTCGHATGQVVPITAPDQLPTSREPCKACWTKDPL